MEGKKSFYLSTTFWGAIILIASVVLKFAGVDITEGEQAAFPEMMSGAVSSIMAVVGFIAVIIGRIKATKKLTW